MPAQGAAQLFPLSHVTVGMWTTTNHKLLLSMPAKRQFVILIGHRTAALSSKQTHASRVAKALLLAHYLLDTRNPFSSVHPEAPGELPVPKWLCVALEVKWDDLQGIDYAYPLHHDGRLVLEARMVTKRLFRTIQDALSYYRWEISYDWSDPSQGAVPHAPQPTRHPSMPSPSPVLGHRQHSPFSTSAGQHVDRWEAEGGSRCSGTGAATPQVEAAGDEVSLAQETHPRLPLGNTHGSSRGAGRQAECEHTLVQQLQHNLGDAPLPQQTRSGTPQQQRSGHASGVPDAPEAAGHTHVLEPVTGLDGPHHTQIGHQMAASRAKWGPVPHSPRLPSWLAGIRLGHASPHVHSPFTSLGASPARPPVVRPPSNTPDKAHASLHRASHQSAPRSPGLSPVPSRGLKEAEQVPHGPALAVSAAQAPARQRGRTFHATGHQPAVQAQVKAEHSSNAQAMASGETAATAGTAGRALGSIPPPARWTVASRVLHNRTVVLRFRDVHLPEMLRTFVKSDLRLLKLYEAGLPSWAVFLPTYGLWYRPWMRRATWLLFTLISLVSMCLGFYDLWKHVPIVRQAMVALSERVVPRKLLEWLEQHAQIRLSILLTYLWAKSPLFSAVLRSLRSTATALSQLLGPVATWVRTTVAPLGVGLAFAGRTLTTALAPAWQSTTWAVTQVFSPLVALLRTLAAALAPAWQSTTWAVTQVFSPLVALLRSLAAVLCMLLEAVWAVALMVAGAAAAARAVLAAPGRALWTVGCTGWAVVAATYEAVGSQLGGGVRAVAALAGWVWTACAQTVWPLVCAATQSAKVVTSASRVHSNAPPGLLQEAWGLVQGVHVLLLRCLRAAQAVANFVIQMFLTLDRHRLSLSVQARQWVLAPRRRRYLPAPVEHLLAPALSRSPSLSLGVGGAYASGHLHHHHLAGLTPEQRVAAVAGGLMDTRIGDIVAVPDPAFSAGSHRATGPRGRGPGTASASMTDDRQVMGLWGNVESRRRSGQLPLCSQQQAEVWGQADASAQALADDATSHREHGGSQVFARLPASHPLDDAVGYGSEGGGETVDALEKLGRNPPPIRSNLAPPDIVKGKDSVEQGLGSNLGIEFRQRGKQRRRRGQGQGAG